jgi:hypothetical protein
MANVMHVKVIVVVVYIFHYTIDGIISYGEQCASPMKPGIYTRVSNYIDWIQKYSDFDLNDI